MLNRTGNPWFLWEMATDVPSGLWQGTWVSHWVAIPNLKYFCESAFWLGSTDVTSELRKFQIQNHFKIWIFLSEMYYCICGVGACLRACMEVKGQPLWISSLHLPAGGFQGLNAGHSWGLNSKCRYPQSRLHSLEFGFSSWRCQPICISWCRHWDIHFALVFGTVP